MDLLDFHKIKGYTQEKQPGSEKDMDPRPIVSRNTKLAVN